MILTGSEITRAVEGELLQGNPQQKVSGFAIDSRLVNPGDFFIPLEGEHTDGHRFIAMAFANRAETGPGYFPGLPAHRCR
jgi:UDP-N-acetylmuramoyl-tripeptide--D-alanyl-D-alanine ligase